MPLRKTLVRPVIFGLADGSMSIIGVILYAAGHHADVFPYAVAGGVSAAISMAGGEWLSDSGSGFWAALAMGVSVLGGAILPAVPYVFLKTWAAAVVSGVLLAVVALSIAQLRQHRRHPFAETFAVLALVIAGSVTCAIWI
jgi:VIT1/CCC1 family predicted Fe2+/Mn2+ transporter